ncbi:MAG: AzlC family ABC transporter permease [Gemmobacter sp.]|nr:AzlC family ABC transporter permease [Gemmobacter sp.]
MSPSSPQQTSFWRGFRAGAPFLIIIGPFAMLFGVLSTEQGLTLTETMAFSVLVIAGASQFAALQLMADNAPALIVVVTSLAVNMRMVMYSAALTPWLGQASVSMRAALSYFLVDQTYAASILEYENRPHLTLSERIAYFMGVMMTVCPLWYLATWVGATMGTAIPPEFALDFAVPITFIAILSPMLRTPAHVVSALVSVTIALALWWMPYSTGLLVASIVAMIAGASVETWMESRKGPRL